MSIVRASSGRSVVPSIEELKYIGMENWQIKIVQQMSPTGQWAAHDEYIRRLMSNGETDSLSF